MNIRYTFLKDILLVSPKLFFDMDTYIESKPAENQDFFREVRETFLNLNGSDLGCEICK